MGVPAPTSHLAYSDASSIVAGCRANLQFRGLRGNRVGQRVDHPPGGEKPSSRMPSAGRSDEGDAHP